MTTAKSIKKVPQYCYQCVAGPDLLRVEVTDGVATEVRPNDAAAEVHPAGGKVCVKAFGLIQKTNNPHRITTPMIRSNSASLICTAICAPSSEPMTAGIASAMPERQSITPLR